MLWRSLGTRGRPPEPKVRRYTRSIVIAAVLDGLLALQWASAGRSLRELGLEAPISVAGLVGLGLAVCVLGLMIANMVARPSPTASSGEDPAADMLPETRAEVAIFVIFSLVVGSSWEALYRGFLIWALPPHLGLIVSIAVAAGAYGAAHGFKNAKMFVGSLVSALVFTVAFAVTRSLWWLILIHCGLPLIGALTFHGRRRASAPAISPIKSRAQPSSP